jgi:hypothetical protein
MFFSPKVFSVLWDSINKAQPYERERITTILAAELRHDRGRNTMKENIAVGKCYFNTFEMV